ncbi:uncharacterized protein LOC121726052 [Aricia agestis]|uniref:uncharacterized protein LOC121726052 n=1 Tax=Aricia agestis TaxID=91739 RepID=UPI001C20785B|nr:uncharacterized protein LOC121726052 [Aricia agestis]
MLKLGRWKTPVGFFRRYHEHRVTDNIQFITIHNDKITVDPKTLHIRRRIHKPICVQLNWMSASAAVSRRYSRLLLDDLDVVVVRCDVRHVLQRESGVQKIALDLLRLMSVNDATYVVFGLSIGSYLWSEALVHAARDPQYQPVLDRVSAQIWDSIADLKHTPTGIPLAVFPNLVNNKRAFQWVTYVFDSWYKFYIKSCYTSVTAHYERAAHTFLHTACRAPALVLHADNDIISPWQYARKIHDVWTESGIKTTWKCWEKSNHVSSYMYHPQEYKTLVWTHIQQNVPGLTISGLVP